ncbi:MAG: hypothetical protein LUI12_01255 [Clostridiales bacterium]|nr:hypothetical protein [Clostridiales bacterium]
MKKILSSIVLCAIAVFMLVGCGSKKPSFEGYYTCAGSSHNYALSISKNGDIMYSSDKSGWYLYHGTGTTTNEGTVMLMNFDKGYDNSTAVNEFTPLMASLSDDGETLFLASDSSSWKTDTFIKCTEKEYKAFCEENNIYTTEEELKNHFEEAKALNEQLNAELNAAAAVAEEVANEAMAKAEENGMEDPGLIGAIVNSLAYYSVDESYLYAVMEAVFAYYDNYYLPQEKGFSEMISDLANIGVTIPNDVVESIKAEFGVE